MPPNASHVKVFAAPQFTCGMIPYFSDYAAQLAWMYNAAAIWEGDAAGWKPGDAIVLDTDPNSATHVYAEWGGRGWWYLVMSVAANAPGRWEMRLSLDPWLTYKTQNNLTLTAGNLTRCKNAPFYSMERDAIKWKATGGDFALTYASIVACVLMQNSGGSKEIWYIALAKPAATLNEPENSWIYTNNINPQDVLGAWYTPFSIDDFTDYWTAWDGHANVKRSTYPWAQKTIRPASSGPVKSIFGERYALMDWRGGIITDFPLAVEVSNIWMRLDMTSSGCRLLLNISPINTGDPTLLNPWAEQMIAGMVGYMECMEIPIVYDQWAIYKAAQRQIDVDQANLDQAVGFGHGLTSAITQTAQTAALGGAFGGMGVMANGPTVKAANKMGAAKQTAMISGSASMGMQMIDLMIDTIARPYYQDLTDRGYKAQAASVVSNPTMRGDMGVFALAMVKLTMDDESRIRYMAEIQIRGWPRDDYVQVAESFLPGPLQGDFELFGNAPLDAKTAIRQMVIQGIRAEAP